MRKKKPVRAKKLMKNGELPRLRRYGRTEFWVDTHHRRNAVMVECDDPNYPVIAVYLFKTAAAKLAAEAAATRLLERIKQQKVDYRLRAMNIPVWARWNRNYAILFEKTGVSEEAMY